MEAALQQLLSELETYGRENDAREQDRSNKMLNLERDTAHLLSILIRSSSRTRLLEIGTSNGYSTIWLSWAAQAAGGHVTSIERNPEKQAQAEQNLRRAGLRERVDFKLGDATEIVASLPGSFDFVFFDADRLSAPDQLKLLLPKLSPGALVTADNVLSHPDEIAPYLAAVNALADFDHQVLPVGKGLSLAYKFR
ncbi:MAG: class I SAM-dependent methyltransferase [Chloroflexota bacterium]